MSLSGKHFRFLIICILLVAATAATSCKSNLLIATPAALEVTISGMPDSVITHSSAALSFRTSQSVTVSVEYGLVSGVYTQSVPRTAAAGIAHTVSLEGLIPATVYYYRVVSYLGTARSFSSGEYSLTTAVSPGEIPLEIEGTPLSAPQPASADISFATTVPGTYTLEYRPSTDASYTRSTPRTSLPALTHSSVLTALSPSVTYYYRIGLYLDGKFSGNSGEYSFITAPDPLESLALSGEPAVVPGYDTAEIEFTTSADAVYILEYGIASNAYTKATPVTTIAGKNHHASLSSLLPLTDYYYRITLYPSGTVVRNRPEYVFKTENDPNEILAVAGLPSVSATATSLKIDWTSNYSCSYILEYGAVSGVYTVSLAGPAAVGTIHSATVPGLAKGGRKYYYRIQLLRDIGNDCVSAEYSTETLPSLAQKNRGIWILGGLSGPTVDTALGLVDLYDPVAGAWFDAVTTLPQAVSFAGYASCNGKLYVIGGFDSGGTALTTVQVYDIASAQWNAGNPLSPGRANIHATVMNGKIYVLSGTQGAAAQGWALVPPDGRCDEYAPGVGWTVKPGYTVTSNSERFSYPYQGTLYSLAGRSGPSELGAAAHDGFIPWQAAPALTTQSEVILGSGLTGVSGVMYVDPDGQTDSLILLGGLNSVTGTTGCFINYTGPGVFPSSTASPHVQYLASPLTAPEVWKTASNGLGSGAGFGSAVVSTVLPGDRIYYFGGTDALGDMSSGTPVSSIGMWTAPPSPPAVWNDVWSDASDSVFAMPRARWGHGAVTLNQ